MQTEKERMLSTKDVANYLGIHLVTVYRMIRDKKLPFSRIGGRWRIHKMKLDKWAEEKAICRA